MSTAVDAPMLNIPEEKLPKEWKDEARLDSLYSPFRSRTVNPRDYDTKVSSWKNLLTLYCVNNGTYTFTLSLLNKIFIRNGRPPSCLPVVVAELSKGGVIQPLEEYLKTSPQTWGGWMTNTLVKRPLIWSYNTIKRSLFTNNNPEISYVHIEVIQQESEKLQASIPASHTNKLVDLPEFLKLINRETEQIEGIKLLLHHLSREKKVDLTTLTNGTNSERCLIKIGYPISDVDIGVYVLEQNEKLFTKYVQELEDQVPTCIAEIKGHLRKGHRQLAKTCLKKKHEIEKRLTKKTNALHNIQVLLEKIKDVHADADVWKSYKHALAAFNTTFKETGLSENAVEDTMLKLGEMMDIHDDIQAVISKPVSSEDIDIEEELANLLKTGENIEPVRGGTSGDDLDELLATLDISSLPEVLSLDASREASLG